MDANRIKIIHPAIQPELNESPEIAEANSEMSRTLRVWSLLINNPSVSLVPEHLLVGICPNATVFGWKGADNENFVTVARHCCSRLQQVFRVKERVAQLQQIQMLDLVAHESIKLGFSNHNSFRDEFWMNEVPR